MGCVYLIEPVIGIYAFCMFMTYPLLQQYVYRRLWLQLSGAPYPIEENNTHHCADNSTNLTSIHVAVQEKASLFHLYAELCFIFPSLLSSPLLVSYSDICGRKVAILAPLVGDCLFTLCYSIVSALSLDLNILLGASVVSGLLGGPTALIGGCFAYVADRCEPRLLVAGGGESRGVSRDRTERGGDVYAVVAPEGHGRMERGMCETGGWHGSNPPCQEGKVGVGGADDGDGSRDDSKALGEGLVYAGRDERGRTVRMAGLDMIMGILCGLASLCTGFFIHAAGFTWPFATAALLHLTNLAYVLCVLRESLSRAPAAPSPSSTFRSSSTSSSSSSSGLSSEGGSSCLPQRAVLMGQLKGMYLVLTSGTRQRNVMLGLMLTAFALYKVSSLGGMSIFILYELNKPLCWSEVFIGYGSAISTLMHLGSFAGVAALSRCLQDTHIVLLGLLSVSAGLLMASFAKTTLLMFLVRLPLVLSSMPTPVLKSMMSKAVLSSEQGAMFACIAFVEMLSVGGALTMFNGIYAATVSWFSGFSFLLASGLGIIPAVLIGALMCFHVAVEEDMTNLTDEEEDVDTECGRETLQLPQWDTSQHAPMGATNNA